MLKALNQSNNSGSLADEADQKFILFNRQSSENHEKDGVYFNQQANPNADS